MKCRRVILFFENRSEPADKEAFQAVDALIAEFDAVDPGSDAFRFAHDTKGHLIRLAVSEIDLSNLREVVGSLHNFLECVDWHLRYSCDITPCRH